ncbi:MAG TPA: acetate--CoA ligase family protein, partial [Vicinamibacterales bacterium]
VQSLGGFACNTVREVIDRTLEGADGPRWLSPADLNTVLRAAEIEVAQAELSTVDEVREAAARIGYPLVAKAITPGVVHKSDVGGVIMGLKSAAEVADAVRLLQERMNAIGVKLDGVLLQREIGGEIEMMAGVTTDATFGPLLVAGLGGTMVELIKDVAFRLHPVTDIDAAEMIQSLRSSRLLDGYRGGSAGDRAAYAALLTRLSALVEIVPEITEVDLNPIRVLAPGKGAVVVDGRMRIRPSAPAWD